MIPTAHKIQTWQEAQKQIAQWQELGGKVVFTNGCFDILHLGHIDYLEKARALGDRMVVGLNSDWSVRKLKGAERPITQEYARARMLASLAFVDLVVIFTEDTPLQLIECLSPNILVKGDDYQVENIVGADYVRSQGGTVKTIALVPGVSTTQLIERIRHVNPTS